MRKALLIFLTMMAALAVHAEDAAYPYLTIELSDGTKTSVDVSSATVSLDFNETTLTIGQQTFVVGDLTKMYFTTTDETSGILELSLVSGNEIIAIYDLQGRKVSRDQMSRGIYVIKTKNGTRKVNVK
ncbi:MAG: hypothetical protein IJ614_05140 [Prevotella sp.]|nr:hypothetical protein [Prevotella sp.]